MNERSNPLVTVMMPSFNHGRYVRQAVESIFAETYRPLELVVVDDGSSDDSPQILQELKKDAPIPFKLELSPENRGAPISLNRCLELAEGECVSLCASDDMHIPGGMEKMMSALLADDKIQVVYGNGRFMRGDVLTDKKMIGEGSRAFLNESPKEARKRLQTGNFPMWFQNGISRTAMLRKVGGWNPKLKADDGPRARRVYSYLAEHDLKHAFVDVPYYIYRTHETNMHKDSARMRAHILDALESEFSEEERPQALVRVLVRQVRVCLENGNVKDAAQTLCHLVNDLDDPRFEAFLEPLLMEFIKDCVGVERDPGSGQWKPAKPPLYERAKKQKERIAQQQAQLEKYRTRAHAQKAEMRQLKRSASWKIGRLWTKPFRLLRIGDNKNSEER